MLRIYVSFGYRLSFVAYHTKKEKENDDMHCEKYNKQQLANLLAHYERRNNKYRKYNNENIDKSKTHLNYNLAPVHEEGLYQFIKNRVTELNISKRRNTIWACDWCLSAPQEIVGNYDACKEFFEKSYNFLSDRYGEENVVSAYVHFDEGTKENEDREFNSSHMHFCLIPVIHKQEATFDIETGTLKTKEIEKVLAKECINRLELKTIHNELQQYLDEELSFDAKVLTGVTKGQNMSVKQLKQKSELEKEIKEKSEQLEMMKKTISALATNFVNLNEKANHYNNILKNEEAKRENEISKASEQIKNLLDSYNYSVDEVVHQIEIRDNRIHNIDTSYKQSLEVMKELEQTMIKSQELEIEIQEKTTEYKNIKENDDGLEL